MLHQVYDYDYDDQIMVVTNDTHFSQSTNFDYEFQQFAIVVRLSFHDQMVEYTKNFSLITNAIIHPLKLSIHFLTMLLWIQSKLKLRNIVLINSFKYILDSFVFIWITPHLVDSVIIHVVPRWNKVNNYRQVRYRWLLNSLARFVHYSHCNFAF